MMNKRFSRNQIQYYYTYYGSSFDEELLKTELLLQLTFETERSKDFNCLLQLFCIFNFVLSLLQLFLSSSTPLIQVVFVLKTKKLNNQ